MVCKIVDSFERIVIIGSLHLRYHLFAWPVRWITKPQLLDRGGLTNYEKDHCTSSIVSSAEVIIGRAGISALGLLSG
jgi:hypothetical protein